MGELALFQPREALDAETRLAAFIRHARDDLTVFGADRKPSGEPWEIRQRFVIQSESRCRKGAGNAESHALSSGAWLFSTLILPRQT